MSKRLICANWKENMHTRGDITAYFDTLGEGAFDLSKCDVAFAPQFPLIPFLGETLNNTWMQLASQNLASVISWAHTWEVSIVTLKDLSVTYAIIWHAERRSMYGETNQVTNTKIKLCLEHGIKPILCIGETKEQRENGQTMAIIKEQFDAAVEWIDNLTSIDLAYEPVRAIGTWLVPTIEEIAQVHAYLRELANNHESRILYGGSSNDQNAWEFIQIPNVDGFLVWGASLVPEKFAKMIKVCCG